MSILLLKDKGNDKRQKFKSTVYKLYHNIHVYVYFVCFDFIKPVKPSFIHYIHVRVSFAIHLYYNMPIS